MMLTCVKTEGLMAWSWTTTAQLGGKLEVPWKSTCPIFLLYQKVQACSHGCIFLNLSESLFKYMTVKAASRDVFLRAVQVYYWKG